MRVLVLKEYGLLAVESRPDPTPSDDEVVIRIFATGICGSDIHGFTGENGRRFPGQIMGHESVGRIDALGRGAERFGLALGDLATFNPVIVPIEDTITFKGREQHSPKKRVIGVDPDYVSGFAERVIVPARNVVSLPPGIPPSHGALIEPLAVAFHAVGRANVSPGDKVFVVGGGPIGQSIILAALRNGAVEVVVSELDASRRDLCESLGATVLKREDASVADRLWARWHSLADVGIDAVGITATLREALLSTRLGGNVCLVGMGSPELAIDAYRISTDERNLIGSFTYSTADFRDAAAWVSTGEVNIQALIGREVPMEQANDAFAGLARMDRAAGKVLVRLDQ